MTVNTNDTVERNIVSGVGPYPFSFRIFADTDLQVTACSTATPPVPALLTYLTHYTVTGANVQAGGSITLTAGAATTYAGYTLDIRSNTPNTQPTSIRNQGRFLPEIHEDEFDHLEREVQDLKRQLLACVRYPDNVLNDGMMTPLSTWLSRYLTINSSGVLTPAALTSTTLTSALITSLLNGSTIDQDAVLALLMERTDTSPGLTSLKRTAAEIAAGVTPVNYAYAPGNIRRYGAVVNGSTDDAAAIRKALDVAARDGTTVTCEPAGHIKVGSTVYIPQYITLAGDYGFRMAFSGCTFVGQGRGTGTIFESGTGLLSTGGATNFGQPALSGTSIHYGSIIEGARFTACGTAIRLFDWLKGCKLEDLYFDNCDHAVYTLECFYLEVHNCHAVVAAITNTTDVLFDFDGLCNDMLVMGCEAGGGVANVKGIGYRFSIGANVVFIGNTAEGMNKGLVFAASMPGIDIRDNYFESLATCGIDASVAASKTMDISGNWFLATIKAITAAQWVAGRWSESNILVSNDIVEILDSVSQCTIEIPQQNFTETTATAAAAIVPSNYTLTNSVVLRAPRMVYAAASGLAAPIVIDAGTSKVVPVFAYAGGPTSDGAGTFMPFTTQTLNVGSSVIDTQITWSSFRMMVAFDLPGQFGGSITVRLQGIVFSGGSVFRADANATWTVTAANNGGKLRLTIAGAAHGGLTSQGWPGQIRHL